MCPPGLCWGSREKLESEPQNPWCWPQRLGVDKAGPCMGLLSFSELEMKSLELCGFDETHKAHKTVPNTQ